MTDIHERANRSSDRWTCRMAPADVDIVLEGPLTLRGIVERQLAPWCPRFGEAGSVRPHMALDDTGEHSVLRRGDEVLCREGARDRMGSALQHWIDREVVRRVTSTFPVHAGVVSWRGRVLVLPGPSGAGKTTLVAALVTRGAAYGSDELALVDHGGRIHGYPRWPLVKEPSGRERTLTVSTHETFLGGRLASMIVVTRYVPAATSTLTSIPASEALLALLANTPRALSGAADVPIGLRRLAANAASFVGVRGDAESAAATLLDRLDRLQS